MVYTLKFSQIAASGANYTTGDFVLAVQGGTTDVLFSRTQLFANAFATAGVDVFAGAAPPDIPAVLKVLGTTATTSQISLGRFSNDVNDGDFQFYKSRSASIGGHTIVQNNDEVGAIGWNASNGTTYDLLAQIKANVDGIPGAANDMPGRLSFFTKADNSAAAAAERLRISSSGEILPGANDGGPLGSGTLSWSDLFLASGGVINWNNGDVTITHSGNSLSFNGAINQYFFDDDIVINPIPAASTAFITFSETGVGKWVFGKATDDSFILFDAVSGFSVFQFFLGGAVLSFLKPLAPIVNDFVALGASGTGWSDLFLAAGGVINWNSGTATIAEASGRINIDTNNLAVGGPAIAAALTNCGIIYADTVTPTISEAAALQLSPGYAAVNSGSLYGIAIAPAGVAGAASWTNYIGIRSETFSKGAGNTVTNCYSLYLDAQTDGSSVNRSLYVNSGTSEFVGTVLFRSDITPDVNDGAGLGTSALSWSDLFLASGAVINWASSDVTITHSANTLAFAGASSGYTFDALTTITSTSANALTVGRQGSTNPVLKVDASAATVVTGVSIVGAAAAGRAFLAAISSGADEGLSIDAKGTGTVRLGATSTGAIEFSRNAVPTASDGSALGTTALMWADLFLASGGVINFNNGDVTLTHNASNAVTVAGGSWVVGSGALATNATDGFLYIPTCAGTPTGTPTTRSGTVAMVYDSTNKILYIYDTGAASWLGGTVPGVWT